MYNTVPTNDKALGIIEQYLVEHKEHIDLFGFRIQEIIKLLKFLIENTYFTYDNEYYINQAGLTTGGHTSGAYAEIIVDYTYKEALKITPIEPKGLSTYVDDAWLLWTGTLEQFLTFLSNLNSIWPTLNFTYEEEENNIINVLDLKIIRNKDNMTFAFHQKSTHSGTYLNYNSHCSMSIKTNIIFTETKRIINAHSNKDHIWPDLEKLKDHLINSEYPEDVINKFIIKAVNHKDDPNKIKKEYDYLLQIPYISAPFTRKIK